MSGKVVQALRASPLATFLSEAELRMLANCGRIFEYAPDQNIVSADGQDERLFLLREGKADLHLVVNTETRQCSGDAHVELGSPGEFFWLGCLDAPGPGRRICPGVGNCVGGRIRPGEAGRYWHVPQIESEDVATFVRPLTGVWHVPPKRSGAPENETPAAKLRRIS